MKWLKNTFVTLIFGFICAFTFINHTNEQNKSLVQNAKRPIITIWVPGTKLTPTFAFKSFFYRMPGMHKATEYDETYHKRSMAEALCNTPSDEYNLDHFYYFGWNGKLSFTQRKHAAKDMHKAMQYLAEEYKNILGEPPIFRVIAHSHGGNVALNLAKFNKKNASIIIDELILLACPVQNKTKRLVNNACFKKVYAFYSVGDLLQVMDPQGWYKKGKSNKLFSERRFDQYDNVRQARIKVNGRPVMHVDFLLQKFLEQLPTLCSVIDAYYDEIASSQMHKVKQLDIRCKSNPVVINKKLI